MTHRLRIELYYRLGLADAELVALCGAIIPALRSAEHLAETGAWIYRGDLEVHATVHAETFAAAVGIVEAVVDAAVGEARIGPPSAAMRPAT